MGLIGFSGLIVSFIAISGLLAIFRIHRKYKHEKKWIETLEETNNPSKKFMETFGKNDNQSDLS